MKWIKLKKFCADSGITEDAVDKKIMAGIWDERIVCKAPDGRRYVNVENYYLWVEGRLPLVEADE